MAGVQVACCHRLTCLNIHICPPPCPPRMRKGEASSTAHEKPRGTVHWTAPRGCVAFYHKENIWQIVCKISLRLFQRVSQSERLSRSKRSVSRYPHRRIVILRLLGCVDRLGVCSVGCSLLSSGRLRGAPFSGLNTLQSDIKSPCLSCCCRVMRTMPVYHRLRKKANEGMGYEQGIDLDSW